MTNRTKTIAACVAAALLAVGVAGYVIGKSRGGAGASTVETERKPLYWVAPMDPSYRRDKPGKSPMGMDLMPVYADGDGGGASSDVHISPAVVNEMGVRTAIVKQGTLSHQIQAVGYVGYDEDLVTSINTRADGWVEKLYIKTEGDMVREGQPLYELFSPKLATAQSEYLTARASGMSSLVSASRERLRALGFSPSQIALLAKGGTISNRVTRYADRGGVITKLGVREGAYVNPATEVMKISDLSNVWILAEVDQRDAAALGVGQKAVAQFDAYPGRKWHGAIDYVYPDINLVTRTAKIRLRFPNPDKALQPNMYAHVSIDTSPKSNAIYIPVAALIQTGQSQRVAVALGEGRFDVCPVVAGFESDGNVEILKGLTAGQKIVVSAQFLIDSEANLDAAALRMGGGKIGCTNKPEDPGAIKKQTTGSNPSGDNMQMPGMKDMTSGALHNEKEMPQ